MLLGMGLDVLPGMGYYYLGWDIITWDGIYYLGWDMLQISS